MRTVLTVCAYVQRHYGLEGVKDHSLPSTVRRLCSAGRQANLLMSAVFGSTLAAPGRRTSVDVRSSNGVFFGLPQTAFFCACMAAYRSRRCYLYCFFPYTVMPVILDMLIEAYLGNLELWVLLLQVYTILLFLTAIYLGYDCMHEVTLRGFCLTLCYDVMLSVFDLF